MTKREEKCTRRGFVSLGFLLARFAVTLIALIFICLSICFARDDIDRLDQAGHPSLSGGWLSLKNQAIRMGDADVAPSKVFRRAKS